MNWFVSLLLWGCVLPMLPIEYFLMRDEMKFKKNIAVGVTFPYEARSNPDVVRRLEQYKRDLKRVFLLMLVIAAPCMLIRDMGAAFFAWGTWILMMVVLPNIPYAVCNRELKEIKQANGWNRQPRDILWVDTGAIKTDKWLSTWLFVPAVLLSLLPLGWDRELFVVYIIDAVSAFGCWMGYRYLYRNRAEVVDGDQTVSQALGRVRRRNWGKVWLYCAYCMALLNLSVWLMIKSAFVGMMLILMIGVLLMYAAVRIEFSTRRVQEKLTAESGKEWYADEDDKWIWGLFYYNPNDSRIMINNRVGVNSTFNLARPAGKVFAFIIVLMLLSIPCMGFMLDGIGNKPLDLQINDSFITASYGNSTYEIEIGMIDEAAVLEELPQGLRRIGGTGADNLLKGRFSASELGNLTLCLDPQCPPFLLVKTTDGRQFLFGAREPNAVERVFSGIGK